jgi:hypothetical protein
MNVNDFMRRKRDINRVRYYVNYPKAYEDDLDVVQRQFDAMLLSRRILQSAPLVEYEPVNVGQYPFEKDKRLTVVVPRKKLLADGESFERKLEIVVPNHSTDYHKDVLTEENSNFLGSCVIYSHDLESNAETAIRLVNFTGILRDVLDATAPVQRRSFGPSGA